MMRWTSIPVVVLPERFTRCAFSLARVPGTRVTSLVTRYRNCGLAPRTILRFSSTDESLVLTSIELVPVGVAAARSSRRSTMVGPSGTVTVQRDRWHCGPTILAPDGRPEKVSTDCWAAWATTPTRSSTELPGATSGAADSSLVTSTSGVAAGAGSGMRPSATTHPKARSRVLTSGQ